MTRNQILSTFFLALFLFVIAQVVWILSPFAKALFWACILAFAFYPVHKKFKETLHLSEAAAAVATTAVIFLSVVPLAIFVFASLAAEAVKVSEWILAYVRDGKWNEFLVRAESWEWVRKFENSILGWDFIQKNSESWITSSVSALGHFAVRQTGVLAKNIVSTTLGFFLTLFLVFFLLKDGRKIHGFLYEIAPLEEETKKHIFGQVQDIFSAVIRGQIVTALVQSGVSGVVFWALGLPLPIFFAGVSFLASMIPFLGCASVWVPFVVYLLFMKAFVKAGILLFLGTFVISLIDNLLKPLLIGGKTKLPYLLLFLGILGGVKVYGFVGIFLAPVALSLFFVLIKIYQEKFLQ